MMKLSLKSAVFVLPFYLSHSAEAALDCNVQVGRAETPAVCAHFEGVAADPYYQWYEELNMQSRYTGTVYLQGSDASKPENGAAVHWKVDEESVHLAVAVRATGWLGFGISAGGMLGADMAIFEANKPNEIIDAYTTDQLVPVTDDCASNWELVSFQRDDEGGFMMIEFKRPLDTNDPQDIAIFNDLSTLVVPHRVIAAWGDSEEFGYHGLNRARGAIRFYGVGDDTATFFKNMEEQSEGTFLVASINHQVAAMETEYAYTCVTRNDLIDQGVVNTTDIVNIIGFEPIIQDGNEPYVHHYIIYGYQTPECPVDGMQELVYVWGPGDVPFSLPDNLGTPLFGANGFQSFHIEVHYNNPQLVEGIIDSSGVRVYWTSQPRDEQLGILSVGDPVVELFGQPVGDGFTMHSFDCPGSCSTVAGQTVTVVREYLHMHESGARIMNEHIRNGEVIRRASLDYWEFHQNGNAPVQQDPFVIQPGDAFKTSCYFNGQGRVFGLASSEEMCIAFLYYYPRVMVRIEAIDLEIPWMCGYNLGFDPCTTIYDSKNLTSAQDLGRNFGTSAADVCDEVGGPADAPVETPSGETSNSSGSPLHVGLLFVMVLAVMF